MATYPFVRIVWWDAQDYYKSSWTDISDAKTFADEACEVTSFGFLLVTGKAYVVIARDKVDERDATGQVVPGGTTYGGVTKIPRLWIRSVKKIQPKKVR